jgi:hypothetical protein
MRVHASCIHSSNQVDWEELEAVAPQLVTLLGADEWYLVSSKVNNAYQAKQKLRQQC